MMPLADIGTLVLGILVFVIHLLHFNLAFSYVDPSLLIFLYCITKTLARRPEDVFDPPPIWPPEMIH